jgi:uncharacterized membrane protein
VSSLKKNFAAGILTLIPIAATYLIFRWLFETFDGLLAPVSDRAFGRHLPGIGLIFSLLLVLAVGALSTNVFGKKILAYLSKILENIPLVKSVYSGARQMVLALAPSGRGLKRVVLVEFPRKGVYSIGFVTSRAAREEAAEAGGGRWVTVLIPAALNPTSGIVIVVPEEELVEPGFSVEEGVKLVVSGGFVAPERFVAGAKFR